MTQQRSVTSHMGSHSVTCYPTPVNTPDLHFTPARQAGTPFTDNLRMEGSVSPGPWCKEQLAHGCYATARRSGRKSSTLNH